MERTIGQRLDALGVRADLDEEDLVADVVAILCVHEPGEREPRILLATSEGTSNLTASGMLHAASVISDAGWTEDE